MSPTRRKAVHICPECLELLEITRNTIYFPQQTTLITMSPMQPTWFTKQTSVTWLDWRLLLVETCS